MTEYLFARMDDIDDLLGGSLDDIADLLPTDGAFIVGDGVNWVTESGSTARTSLGLGALDAPTFAGLTIPTANGGIDLGSTGASNTPYIDFHSSGNNLDYDSRIIASGGAGSVGYGTLTLVALLAGLSASGSTQDARFFVFADAARGAQYSLQSGSGIIWRLITQDDYASNRLVFRSDSTDRLYFGTDGIYLPLADQRITFMTDMYMEKDDAITTTLPRVRFGSTSEQGTWYWQRSVTTTPAELSNGRPLVYMETNFESDSVGVDLGRTCGIDASFGLTNADTKGTGGALVVSTVVGDMAGPISEPFVQLNYLYADVLNAYTNHNGVNYWLFDNNVVGPKTGQEGYLSGGTWNVVKYASGNTIDGDHMGSNIIALCTTPLGGCNAPSRSGEGLTSYEIGDALVITGFAGAADSVSTGSDPAATSAFVNAIRIGGSNGAGWMHQRASKYATAIYITEYTTYGIHLLGRHASGSAGALYVQDGAGSVGIWREPQNDDTVPLIVGKSKDGEQIIRVYNESTHASALAIFEAVGEGVVTRLSASSTNAGDAGSVGCSGGNFYVAGDNNVLIRISGTDELHITATAVQPFTDDGLSLGSTGKAYSDLWLATGAVINIGASDFILTHSTGLLSLAGSVTVTGGLRVGFTGSPTADRIEVGDANFYLDFTSTLLNFDGGDYFAYDRSGNNFAWVIGSSTVSTLSGSRFRLDFNSGTLPNPPTETTLHIGQADSTVSRIINDSWGTGVGSKFTGRSARGTAASPSASQADDELVSFSAIGFGATVYAESGRADLKAHADGNWTDASHPTRWSIWVTASSSTTVAEVARMSSEGFMGFGATVPSARVHANYAGTVQFKGFNTAAASSTGGAFISLYHDDNTVMTSGERLGGVFIGGAVDTANTVNNSIAIQGFATETWTGSTAEAVLVFELTASGALSRTERARIGPTGVTIANGLRVGFSGAPTDDRIELGDATFYLDFGSKLLNFDSNDYFGYDRSTNVFSWVIGGSGELGLSAGSLFPVTDGGLQLGDSTHQFADLFLESGAVINWASSDVTLTHASNTLTFTGMTTINVEGAIIISTADPFLRLVDTDTGADNSIQANNSTGSLQYFADFNNEVASSTHNWFIDDTGGTLRMQLSTSGLAIAAGLNVGFTSAPTADRVAVGDTNMYLDYNTGTTPLLQFDGNDYMGYSRGSNFFQWVVGGAEKMRVDGSATATHTALLIFDVDNNTLERVTVGAAGSGGSGFKVLRIPD